MYYYILYIQFNFESGFCLFIRFKCHPFYQSLLGWDLIFVFVYICLTIQHVTPAKPQAQAGNLVYNKKKA